MTERIIVGRARYGQQSIRLRQARLPLYTVWGADCRPAGPANELMKYRDLITEIVNTYQQHGWELQRVLLRAETSTELADALASNSFSLDDVRVDEALVDGLWFSRPSHQQREAWELRLLAENPFALFETFEKDETEEQREEVRREMEARLRDYVKPVLSDE